MRIGTQLRFTSGIALLLTLYCQSTPPVAQIDFTPTSRPDGFFLLPPPLSSNETPLLKLFSAPVISLELIEIEARKYESSSRKELQERMAGVTEEFCRLTPGQKRAALQSWESKSRRELSTWRMMQDYYENSLQFHLKKNSASDELETAQRLRKTVVKLQRERQKLVFEAWQSHFLGLKKGIFCQADALLGADSFELPTEKLYLPLYISLYDFYGYLPTRVRMELIIKLHSDK